MFNFFKAILNIPYSIYSGFSSVLLVLVGTFGHRNQAFVHYILFFRLYSGCYSWGKWREFDLHWSWSLGIFLHHIQHLQQHGLWNTNSVVVSIWKNTKRIHESLYELVDLFLRELHSSLCLTPPRSTPPAAHAGETAAPRGLWQFSDRATLWAWAFPQMGVSTVWLTWPCSTTSVMLQSFQMPAAQVRKESSISSPDSAWSALLKCISDLA